MVDFWAHYNEPCSVKRNHPIFRTLFRVSEVLFFCPDFMESPEENLTKQMDDCWGAILGKLCTTLQILNTIVLGASSPNIVIGV